MLSEQGKKDFLKTLAKKSRYMYEEDVQGEKEAGLYLAPEEMMSSELSKALVKGLKEYIAGTQYNFGGGHKPVNFSDYKNFFEKGVDCSGGPSFVLRNILGFDLMPEYTAHQFWSKADFTDTVATLKGKEALKIPEGASPGDIILININNRAEKNYTAKNLDDGVAYDHMMVYMGQDENDQDIVFHAGSDGNIQDYSWKRYNSWGAYHTIKDKNGNKVKKFKTEYKVKWLRLNHEKLKKYSTYYLHRYDYLDEFY
jgi:hypothetical protein